MDRELIRKAFGQIIETEMVGEGKLLYGVSPVPVKVIPGSPFVFILPVGTNRSMEYLGTNEWNGAVKIEISVIVQVSDGATYTEVNSSDIVDRIEKKLSEVILANKENELWTNIEYDGETSISLGEVGKQGYFYKEQITLLFEVM
ncbi:MAG: hypothetical protein KGZ97_09690 [Bacteroidetes bacterium]|nr:hypothetical protein [Bacteroidota bacterium]